MRGHCATTACEPRKFPFFENFLGKVLFACFAITAI